MSSALDFLLEIFNLGCGEPVLSGDVYLCTLVLPSQPTAWLMVGGVEAGPDSLSAPKHVLRLDCIYSLVHICFILYRHVFFQIFYICLWLVLCYK